METRLLSFASAWTHFTVYHNKGLSKRTTLTRYAIQYETKRNFSTSQQSKQNHININNIWLCCCSGLWSTGLKLAARRTLLCVIVQPVGKRVCYWIILLMEVCCFNNNTNAKSFSSFLLWRHKLSCSLCKVCLGRCSMRWTIWSTYQWGEITSCCRRQRWPTPHACDGGSRSRCCRAWSGRVRSALSGL